MIAMANAAKNSGDRVAGTDERAVAGTEMGASRGSAAWASL